MTNEWTVTDVQLEIMNPDNINEVGRDQWVKANLRLIEANGVEWWLSLFAAGYDENLPEGIEG